MADTIDDDEPSFPTVEKVFNINTAKGFEHCVIDATQGMTLHDYFAGQAMAGMLASENGCSLPAWPDDSTLESRAVPGAYKQLAVQDAYAWADAMIAEKRRRKQQVKNL